jgi:succinate dehydrogenase hydrophobic anchor subunit
MTPRGPSGDGPLDRLVDVLASPTHRVNLLVALAYVAAVGGLAVVLAEGANPRGDLFVVGLLLLVFAFLTLFYVSVTVADVAGGR